MRVIDLFSALDADTVIVFQNGSNNCVWCKNAKAHMYELYDLEVDLVKAVNKDVIIVYLK